MDTQIQISSKLFTLRINQLTNEINQLKTQLNYEKNLRREIEQELAELKVKTSKKRHRRTKEEQEQAETMEYSPYTSDGRKKAQKADSIGSYQDYIDIKNYLGDNARWGIRNETIWTLGIAMGFRVSDLCKLKYKYFFNENWEIRQRVVIYEQKTLKINNALITEVVRQTLKTYINSLKSKPKLDDYVFRGQGESHMKTNTIYKILKPAQTDLKLNFNFSTHTMRSSFANIAACCGVTPIDMNTITTVQGLLNHSDQNTTLRYLGKLEALYDSAREKVSDFLLGKIEKTIDMQSNHSVNDVYEQIEEIYELIKSKENDKK